MKRIIIALFLAPFLAGLFNAPATAQKTKSQLTTEIGTTYPDNTGGQITPLGVRTYETDLINSIMPTAPVVAGNLACFNGTTGLLQDCGSAPATVPLTIGTTPINSATSGNVLYANGTLLGQYTPAQLTAQINLATSLLSGAVPAWPNNTTTFFRGDGSYQQPGFSILSGSLACSQTPALTGDVTTTAGSCATTIASSAVTYAKMQNVSASRLLGNPTGSPAAPSEISLGSTLGFSGTTLNCTTGTTSQIGCLKPDGTTITVASGTITAVGGSATTVTPGTTTVTGGSANAGYALTNAGGTLANNQLYSTAGGYINKFRNGTFIVWQRGQVNGVSSSPTATTAPGNYTLDGWQVQQTGAAFNCTQASGGNNGTNFALQCVGGTSNTDTLISQPIESSIAAPLAGQTVTVQYQFKQDTGISVTPKISSCFASATDNFTTCTGDLASTSLSACASGSWCTESYTFAASASAKNGYRITFDCNTALTAAQHCLITAADVRVTPGVATGINANPPLPELRPAHDDLQFCQRYYQIFTTLTAADDYALGPGVYPTTTAGYILIQFLVNMRANPTMAIDSGSAGLLLVGTSNITPSAVGFSHTTVQSTFITATVAGATAGQAFFSLIPTGHFITAISEL